MTAKNATTRFSSRVDDYVKYRPHYPVEILDLLAAKCAMTPESVIDWCVDRMPDFAVPRYI